MDHAENKREKGEVYYWQMIQFQMSLDNKLSEDF